MNFATKLQLLNTRAKVHLMFQDMPWYISADADIDPKTLTPYIIVYIDRLSHDAAQLMNTLPKIKVDRIHLKPVLKDR